MHEAFTSTRGFEGMHALDTPFDVVVPGRVNLIGEHIDYSKLSVLPMAIQRQLRLHVSPRSDDRIVVTSRAANLEPTEFDISASVEPLAAGHWGNYVRAPVQALMTRDAHRKWLGFRAHVSSDLPAAAGLSSSSALVIAIGYALLHRNGVTLDPLELAEHMAHAERYVGVRGGGMDQAICVGAELGCASRVDFDPLRVHPVRVPESWSFIVAHSLTHAQKSGAVREAYNQRTSDVRQALEQIWPSVCSAGDDSEVADATPSYRRLIDLDIERLLRLAERELATGLLARFRHTLTEAKRVYAAEHALRQGQLDTFGRLMNASHASLRDDFDVSTPKLDALVDLALQAGAAGARLTGAGFGGCVLVLAHRDQAAQVLDALRREYYAPQRRHDGPRDDDVLFAVTASRGAAVQPSTLAGD